MTISIININYLTMLAKVEKLVQYNINIVRDSDINKNETHSLFVRPNDLVCLYLCTICLSVCARGGGGGGG